MSFRQDQRRRNGVINPAKTNLVSAASAGHRVKSQWDVPTFLLALFILTVTLGPRLRAGYIGGSRAVDLRLQDVLVPICISVLLLAPSASKVKIGAWNGLRLAFIAFASCTMYIHFLVR